MFCVKFKKILGNFQYYLMKIWYYWKITILFGLFAIFSKLVFLYRLSQTFFVSALFMKLQEDYKKVI